MKHFIENTLKQNICTEHGGVWFCGNTYPAPTPIKRRPATIARDRANWSAWRKANHNYFSNKLSSRHPGQTLLDLGAGPQHFKDLTERFNVCAVEFEIQEDIDVVCDLTNELPFHDSTYDIVLLSNVLEHVHDPEFLMHECHRVLKGGGILVGTVPFLMSSHQRPYDFLRYTDIYLERLCMRTGYRECEVISLGKISDVLTSASHQFFMGALRSYKRESFTGNLRYLLCVALQKIHKRTIDLLEWVIGTKPSTLEVTEGYGFSCYKK